MTETRMDRRLFLRNAALLTAGVVAADQLELVERLTHKRRFFAGWGGDDSAYVQSFIDRGIPLPPYGDYRMRQPLVFRRSASLGGSRFSFVGPVDYYVVFPRGTKNAHVDGQGSWTGMADGLVGPRFAAIHYDYDPYERPTEYLRLP